METAENGLLNAMTSDLAAFKAHGGKVIQYHGWSDPQIAPSTRAEGTSNFDMLRALEQWVERGEAPEQIAASRVRNNATDRTRPLCPYPRGRQRTKVLAV